MHYKSKIALIPFTDLIYSSSAGLRTAVMSHDYIMSNHVTQPWYINASVESSRALLVSRLEIYGSISKPLAILDDSSAEVPFCFSCSKELSILRGKPRASPIWAIMLDFDSHCLRAAALEASLD